MRGYRPAAAALGILFGTLGALPAAAQMVTATDPNSIVLALKAEGYSATLGKDKLGDPKIESNIDDTKFTIWFQNCRANEDCATIQFSTGYDLKGPLAWDKVNEWNRTRRFGHAYLDDDADPYLQMDLDLDEGGMSQALFRANLETWAALVGAFEEHIGW